MRVCVLLIVSLFWLKANAQEEVDSSAWELVIPVEISESRNALSNIVKLNRNDFLSMPASFDDPSRLLVKFPGFSNSNDQNNGIVYHGLPSWMSGWSLYGSEILNPNHLSTAGTFDDLISPASGGVNAFSGQVIGEYTYRANPDVHTTSDYYAGVSDIKIRDPYKNQVSLNTSLIGMEAGVDLKSKHFDLVSNARYSTVGLLSLLGADFDGEEIDYQDVMTKLGYKRGMLSIDAYGLYGSSRNYKDYNLDDPTDEADLEKREQDENLLVVGAHMEVLKERSSFETTVNYSSQEKTNSIESVAPWAQDNPIIQNGNAQLISMNSSLHLYREKMDWEINYRLKKYGRNDLDDAIYQAALFNKYYFSSRLSLYTSLSWSAYWISNKWEFKPNLSMALNWIDKSYNYKTILKLSTNNQAGYLPIVNNEPRSVNINLSVQDVKRAMSYAIFYHNFSFLEHINSPLATNFFSEQNTYFYSPTNFYNSSANILGISISKSQKFGEKTSSYIHWTLTQAKQKVGDIRYNLPHAPLINTSFGLTRSDFLKDGLDISLSTNMHSGFNTGYTSGNQKEFSKRTPFYFRSDLRINYTTQRKTKKYTSMLSLDIQNLTGRKNIVGYYYDRVASDVLPKKQLGFLPVLSWRVVI